MALWQFDVRLVPQASLKGFLLADSDSIGEEFTDAVDWWHGAELPEGWEAALNAVLPRSPSWDSEWKIYGAEDGTRVDLIAEDGKIREVRLRLDARGIEPATLEELISLAARANCSLITSTGHVIGPDPSAVWVELELSPARSFVRDPNAFLNKFARRRADARDE